MVRVFFVSVIYNQKYKNTIVMFIQKKSLAVASPYVINHTADSAETALLSSGLSCSSFIAVPPAIVARIAQVLSYIIPHLSFSDPLSSSKALLKTYSFD